MNTIELPTKPRVSTLPCKSRREAADLLHRAFTGYPLVKYMFADSTHQQQAAFRDMFEALIESRLVRGWPVLGAWLHDRLAGVAVISGPDVQPSTAAAEKLYASAEMAIGPEASARFDAYADLCDVGLPDWPHHYLGILGVNPDFQGQHLGRLLIRALKSFVKNDPCSEGIVLNTESEANLTYYQQSGFRVAHEAHLDGVTTWTMTWRSPEAAITSRS